MTEPSPVKTAPYPRPLSPHLQIWRWSLTMALSVFHRASGCALSAGLLLLVWLLVAAAQGPQTYQVFLDFTRSLPGQIMLFGWSVALYYHLCSGVRHLLMDTGRLLDIKSSDAAGYVIFAATFALTYGTWAYLKHWIDLS